MNYYNLTVPSSPSHQKSEDSVTRMSYFNRRSWILGALLGVCVCFSGCGPKPADNSPKSSAAPAAANRVKVILNWFPEAEHGGFYAAHTLGFYKDVGLDVEIVPGGPTAPVVQQVAGKQITFGVVNAEVIVMGRAEGAPIVAVMAPIQISPSCIIVHEKSGIKSFEEIQDMTLAMSATNPFAKFLQKKYPFKDVRVVPYPGNVAKFLVDDKFAQQGYVFSEPFVMKQQGGDPRVLRVADAGFNPYSSCLITHDDLVTENPELVQKMVSASIKGWQQYLKDPVKTNEYIHSINKEQMSLEILAFGVEELKELVEDADAKEHGIGTMNLKRWQELVSQLEDTELIKAGQVKPSDAFTDQFLKAGK